MSDAETPPWLGASATFASTRWTMVLRAGRDGPGQREALDAFCRHYWYPVYAFVRRRGSAPEEAADLAQEFFARLIEKDWLAEVERRETRFSTLLLTMLQRFLVNDYHSRHRLKRGGGRRPVSMDLAEAEHCYGAESATDETPERHFERRWALAVLASALDRLRDEAAAAGKARHFEVIGPFLSGEPEPSDYDAAAAALHMKRGAVAVAVHRLRHRYREALREEIGGDDPLRQLRDALLGTM